MEPEFVPWVCPYKIRARAKCTRIGRIGTRKIPDHGQKFKIRLDDPKQCVVAIGKEDLVFC